MSQNPLLSLLPNNSPNNPQGFSQSNIISMVQQFMQFKSQFQGDPKQQVMNLLQSGKMTEEQFNQISSMAKQIESLISKK